MNDQNKNSPKDDNRTIADMSGLEGAGLFNPFSSRERENARKAPRNSSRNIEPIELTKGERKALIKASLAFSFKIAMVGFGLMALIFFLGWLYLK